MTRELTKEEAIGALTPARVPACVSLRTTLTHATRPDADALQHIHAQLGKVAFMEPVLWERKEGTHSLLLRVSDGKTDCSFSRVFVFVWGGLSPPPLFCALQRTPDTWFLDAANLEGRRVDVSNPTYKIADKDLSFPSPGCGAGAWDGLPPGHKAQPIDFEVTKPVLERLGLPATQEGV
jgi:hypothetical protein